MQESAYPVRRGVKYLLSREKSLKCKGQWVKASKNYFQQYHAIYCALIGLLPLQVDQDASLIPRQWRAFFLQNNDDDDGDVESSNQDDVSY